MENYKKLAKITREQLVILKEGESSDVCLKQIETREELLKHFESCTENESFEKYWSPLLESLKTEGKEIRENILK